MRTGSRPRTSSTCTSRTWRTTGPGPDCSSSKTVGSVRTGMPRRRPSRTTRARSVPGADGIAIVISSGSASSRMRARSSVVPSTRTPSTRMPRLSGSSSTKPTGSRSSCGLRMISRSDEPAAVAGADDQHAAGSGARGTRAAGARRRCARRTARRRRRQGEQEEEREHAGRGGHGDLAGPRRHRDRVHDRDEAGEHERVDGDRLDDGEVVARARVAPLLDLETQQREDDERRDDRPRRSSPRTGARSSAARRRRSAVGS